MPVAFLWERKRVNRIFHIAIQAQLLFPEERMHSALQVEGMRAKLTPYHSEERGIYEIYRLNYTI